MSLVPDDELEALASDSILDLDQIAQDAELEGLRGGVKPTPEGELGELSGSEEELEVLRPKVAQVSLLRRHRSSLVGPKKDRKRVRVRDLTYYASMHAAGVAKGLLQAVEDTESALSLLDILPDAEQLVTVKTLAQLRLDGCQDQVSVIITRPVVEKEDDTQLVIDHLAAMEVDSVAIVCTADTERHLANNLRRRGYRQGLDYELIETTALLAYEKMVLRQVLSNGTAAGMKLIRKLREKA